MTSRQQIIKRAFDLLVSAAGLLVLWPLLVAIAALVKLSSRGPALYRQQRVGRRGKLFTCVKFRSMRVGFEREGSVTTSADTRITAVGRWLRRFKLDELPQLWNVLVGEMSLVGPRPDVPGYADCLSGDARRLLELRPGITGPATLYFRNEEDLLAKAADAKAYNDNVIWPKKVELNLGYLDRWSLWYDIRLIGATITPFCARWAVSQPQSAQRAQSEE